VFAFSIPFVLAYLLYRAGFAVQDWRRRSRLASVRRNLVAALDEADASTHPGIVAALHRSIDAFDRRDYATARESLNLILSISERG
jgi:hypothetical protein